MTNYNLSIKNDGQKIVETNYFQNAQAKQALCFLSMNAKAFRLLVPDSAITAIPEFTAEIRATKKVIVSRGQGVDMPAHKFQEAHVIQGTQVDMKAPMYDIIWDDGSDGPFSLQTNNYDVVISGAAQSYGLSLLIYGERLELLARYENVIYLVVPFISMPMADIRKRVAQRYRRPHRKK